MQNKQVKYFILLTFNFINLLNIANNNSFLVKVNKKLELLENIMLLKVNFKIFV
jgi:hypothetical protein